MQDTKTAPSDAAGITLDSFMSLTYAERRALMQSWHAAAGACHIVMMISDKPPMPPHALQDNCRRYSHGNEVAARIAYDYLTLGKDVKLPSVPPEWYQAVKDAIRAQYLQTLQITLSAPDAQS